MVVVVVVVAVVVFVAVAGVVAGVAEKKDLLVVVVAVAVVVVVAVAGVVAGVEKDLLVVVVAVVVVVVVAGVVAVAGVAGVAEKKDLPFYPRWMQICPLGCLASLGFLLATQVDGNCGGSCSSAVGQGKPYFPRGTFETQRTLTCHATRCMSPRGSVRRASSDARSSTHGMTRLES